MIVEPRIKGHICATAHPAGCAESVRKQIEVVKAGGPITTVPKRVLVIGASSGFGLATRITAAFGGGAQTIGVFLERPAKGNRTASAGWYLSAAFEEEAKKENLYAKSLNGDAFSDEMKKEVIDLIKKDWGQVDQVIYSLAAPRRHDPRTGKKYTGVLKVTNEPYTTKSVNVHTGEVREVTLPVATEEDIQNSIGIMGGQDWGYWIHDLLEAGVLAEGATTLAYSYIGPELTRPLYRDGTIGEAKKDLERTALQLDQEMSAVKGRALVAVNKALVTQASAAIPGMTLYIILLNQVMRVLGKHEGCIEQMNRMYREKLNHKEFETDTEGRIRMDDWELDDSVQEAVHRLFNQCNTENLPELGGVDPFNREFFQLFGFRIPGVDYSEDQSIEVAIPSID